MILHHLSLGSNDLARSRTFYDAVLGALGLRLLNADDQSLDYGTATWFFSLERPVDGAPATPGNGTHIAFAAEFREQVDTFHRLALLNGGADAGAPGLRPQYDPHYYGAFVRDPDGHKLEAVTFSAQ